MYNDNECEPPEITRRRALFEADCSVELSNLIPIQIKESLQRYVVYGLDCGHFVEAVLRNDLIDAITRADAENLRLIHQIIIYCLNALPSTCWGTPEKVAEWKKKISDEEIQYESNRVVEAMRKNPLPERRLHMPP